MIIVKSAVYFQFSELRKPGPDGEIFDRVENGRSWTLPHSHTWALTDRQRDRTQWERELARFLADLGITPAEASLFNVLSLGLTVPPSDLAVRASYEDYSLAGRNSREDCQSALTACLSKGWLQVIDESALARIREEILDLGLLGPIYGLPPIDSVDFTLAGAEMWERIRAPWRPVDRVPFAFTDVVHIKSSRYFRSRAAALARIEEIKEWDDIASVAGPFPIGPWRAQWWRRFPEGYRIDIEERMHWQGRAEGSGSGCYLYLSNSKAVLPRLGDVLNRHNVTLGEWIVLALMEFGCQSPARHIPCGAAYVGNRGYGLRVSEEECRNGLEACLRYGWLRVVDQRMIEEVHELLAAEPALLPIAHEAQLQEGDVHFSPCGATLYRMIASEWLGPDWEDDLNVEKGEYWEEHRYCTSEAGFRGVATEHLDHRRLILESKVTPIGPWCVYWWERFSAGFRLELKIAEP